MVRNCVAKPLALIETAIFFFLHQDFDKASRSLKELRVGNARDTVTGCGCPFSAPMVTTICPFTRSTLFI